MKYLRLNDIDCYKRSFALSNYVWEICNKWEWFAKSTVGEQFIKSVDSISANIAEGFGRYHKKDKVKFYRYSLGSVMESLDWNYKSKLRLLLSDKQSQHVLEELKRLPKEINQLIQFTKKNLKK